MTNVLPDSVTQNITPPGPNDGITSSYRLLYRGALSLPDSHLLLDGLTFTTRTVTFCKSKSQSTHLLENTLALALESMRGRPSLRLLGCVKLDDERIFLDDNGGVEMDIHPHAFLTRIYFENIFCTTATSTATVLSFSAVLGYNSKIGVKVSLGDADGAETTQIVIFARVCDDSHKIEGDKDGKPSRRGLDLVVARVVARPLAPLALKSRCPRPDDPIPRQPLPVFLFGVGKREPRKPVAGSLSVVNFNSVNRMKNRTASGNEGRAAIVNMKRRRLVEEVNGRLPGRKRNGSGIFKVPESPFASYADGKNVLWDSGFMVPGGTTSGSVPTGPKEDHTGIKPKDQVIEMERANKNVIKQCTVDFMRRTKDPMAPKLDKSQPEFKELFGIVYRGVAFALRSQIKLGPVDKSLVEGLVTAHLEMYICGDGHLRFEGKGGMRCVEVG